MEKIREPQTGYMLSIPSATANNRGSMCSPMGSGLIPSVHKKLRTPDIARLAGEGMVYRRTFGLDGLGANTVRLINW